VIAEALGRQRESFMVFVKRSVLILVGLAAIAYVAAYVAYRATHVEVWARDNRSYVIFGSRVSYYAFRPLSYVDAAVTGIGSHIGPHQ
jgi:hypothetical protein